MSNETHIQLDRINRQIKELVGIYREAVSRSGISENEYWLWYALTVMEGEHTQQELCGMWSLSKQTVNSIISHMVKDGFVRLEPIAGTRNQKRILLTDAGRARGTEIVLPVSAAEEQTIYRMPAEMLSACNEALTLYTKILREELLPKENA